MTYLTVGELRRRLEGLDDRMIVLIGYEGVERDASRTFTGVNEDNAFVVALVEGPE